MGCPGCLSGARERAEQVEKITKQAKQDAIRLQKLMVLYTLADGSVTYMEAGAARAAGIVPSGLVSFFEPATNGSVP